MVAAHNFTTLILRSSSDSSSEMEESRRYSRRHLERRWEVWGSVVVDEEDKGQIHSNRCLPKQWVVEAVDLA